jgi:ClpP class serine protease
MTDRTFVLDRRTLARHRSGQVLALASAAVGRSFAVVEGPSAVRYRRVATRTNADALPRRPRSVIAIVDVCGPMVQRAETFCGYIDGYDAIASRINEELLKPEVGAVLLRIDSPGGDAQGIEEAIRSIVSTRENTGKPVASYVDELAASAGYWLAAGIANAGVYAPRSAQVGSVGCWSMIVDERKALEQDGIAVTVVREPAGKDPANPYAPVLDVAIAREGLVVTAIAERFYSAVANTRGMPAAGVRAQDAAMFLAEQAKGIGLIDEVVSIDDAIARLAAKAVEFSRARAAAANQRPPRRSTMNGQKPRSADGQPPAEGEQPAETGRATAAEVSQSCTECATACTDCADACESGTPDEAMAATSACIAACEACIKTCKSFLGTSDAPAEPKPEPAPAPAPADAQNAAATDRRVVSLLESIESERKAEKDAQRKAAEAAERKKLIASRKIVNKDVRAWLEDSRTPIQSVRDACRALPPSEIPNLAGDVTPGFTRGDGAHGLDERELKICKETGCTPERFAALKAQREAAKAARS